MRLTDNELAAIIHLAKAMAAADGKVESIELLVIARELSRFGVDSSKSNTLLTRSDTMEFSSAIATVSNMSVDNKRYVTAYLGTLMCVDGNVSDSEKALWSLVSLLCGLPTMSIKEALSIMASL